MNGKLKAANLITGTRILCSIGLLFCPALSPLFFALYVIAGLTDMLDGTVARMTGTASKFGAKLDTVADFALVAACLIKLIPVLELPVWVSVWIGAIALIKMINIVSGYVVRKKFIAAHTLMNKVTGVLLFILPLTLRIIDLRIIGSFVCVIATFAAIQEGHYIRTGRLHTGHLAVRLRRRSMRDWQQRSPLMTNWNTNYKRVCLGAAASFSTSANEKS